MRTRSGWESARNCCRCVTSKDMFGSMADSAPTCKQLFGSWDAVRGEQPLHPLAQEQVRLRAMYGHLRRPVDDAGACNHLAFHELPAAQVEGLAVREPVPVVHAETLGSDQHVAHEEIASEQILYDQRRRSTLPASTIARTPVGHIAF